MTFDYDLLIQAFRAALAAADPARLLPASLPSPPKGRTLVVGGGKAAAAMAVSFESNWPSGEPLSGLVVTRYQHGLPAQRIEIVEASHPLPDGRGAESAERMLAEIRKLTPDDLLLVLLSGGGSSLLALPAEGISLKELRSLTKSLLVSGASIQEINTVRKHLTQFSGGRLAVACKAPVRALIISDVVGDDPSNIASGPCAPDPTTFSDALEILRSHSISQPEGVVELLEMGSIGMLPDTPKPGDAVFANVENWIIGSARASLTASEEFLRRQGIRVFNLGEIEGDSNEQAEAHARFMTLRLADTARPFALLSGGETTVNVSNPQGRGGRNTQYLLALGLAAQGLENISAIACDTDGIDGSEDNAGAIWKPDSLHRSKLAGISASDYLQTNRAYDFFAALDDLVVTGPTRTNVNDFRLVLAL